MKIALLTSKIEEYSPSLKSFAFHFTKDMDDANDLYQETMLKAVRYFEKFEEGTNLKAWLFTIMRNTFINDYRRNVKRQAVVSQEEELNSAKLMGSAVVNDSVGKFAMQDINIALQKVVPEYRYTFTRYFEGYKYHEIADELGIPIGTVKTRIHIARLQLKKHLKAYKK